MYEVTVLSSICIFQDNIECCYTFLFLDEDHVDVQSCFKQPVETQDCLVCPEKEMNDDTNSRCELELTHEVVHSSDNKPDAKSTVDNDGIITEDKHTSPTNEVESASHRNGYILKKRDNDKLKTILDNFCLKVGELKEICRNAIYLLSFPGHFSWKDDGNRSDNPEYRMHENAAKTSSPFKINGVKPSLTQLSRGQKIKKVFLNLFKFLVEDTPESQESAEELVLCDQILSLEYCDQGSQTSNEKGTVNKETQNHNKEVDSERNRLEKVVSTLKHDLEQSRKIWKVEADQYKREICEHSKKTSDLDDVVDELQKTLKNMEGELQETLHELGRLSVENTRMMKENRLNLQCQKTLKLKQTSTQTIQAPSFQAASSSTSEPFLGARAMIKPDEQLHEDMEDTARNTPGETAEISTQVFMEESSDREGISLGNIPTTAVERSLYNNYKLLLLTIADRLLTDDVVKLKEWASSTFSVDVSREIINVFWELDGKGHISASNLKPLREFFEKIVRIDLIHLIDCFLQGDYALLRNTNSTGIQSSNMRVTSGHAGPVRTLILSGGSRPRLLNTAASGGKNPEPTLHKSGRFEVEESFVVSRPTYQNTAVKPRSAVLTCGAENQTVGHQKMPGLVVTDGIARDDGKSK